MSLGRNVEGIPNHRVTEGPRTVNLGLRDGVFATTLTCVVLGSLKEKGRKVRSDLSSFVLTYLSR